MSAGEYTVKIYVRIRTDAEEEREDERARAADVNTCLASENRTLIRSEPFTSSAQAHSLTESNFNQFPVQHR